MKRPDARTLRAIHPITKITGENGKRRAKQTSDIVDRCENAIVFADWPLGSESGDLLAIWVAGAYEVASVEL